MTRINWVAAWAVAAVVFSVTGCGSDDEFTFEYGFEPGCSQNVSLATTGVSLGAGGTGASKERSEEDFTTSARWGEFSPLGQEDFFVRLGLDQDDDGDRAAFEKLFDGPKMRVTFSLLDSEQGKAGETLSATVYGLPRGAFPGGANNADVAVLNGGPLSAALSSDDVEATANAFAELVQEFEEIDGPAALIAYCPESNAFVACEFRDDVSYAATGSVELSGLIREEGIFVAEDDESFFRPNYWANLSIVGDFEVHPEMAASVTCAEF